MTQKNGNELHEFNKFFFSFNSRNSLPKQTEVYDANPHLYSQF